MKTLEKTRKTPKSKSNGNKTQSSRRSAAQKSSITTRKRKSRSSEEKPSSKDGEWDGMTGFDE